MITYLDRIEQDESGGNVNPLEKRIKNTKKNFLFSAILNFFRAYDEETLARHGDGRKRVRAKRA